jgi:outer membrane receptor protein involved in Fe transport
MGPLALLLAATLTLQGAETKKAPVTGIVKDSSGGAVPGASVTIRTSSGPAGQTVTGPDGHFSFDRVPEGATVLVVRAGGFAQKEQPLERGEIEVILSPATLFEEITVTPTRSEKRLGDVPASVRVIDSARIDASAALVADDVLRQVPTFSLFRRTSSLAAHPTAQGVSLRGIGPSGVSRTLVLIDDVPFNDPFGGWVYWTRVPLGAVDRIEIVDGSSSSLYGNYAMGGVINIVSSRPARRTAEFRAQYGNRNSPKLDLLGSDVWGKLGVAAEGSLFDTDGYPQVAAPERGPVDTNVMVQFKNLSFKADYSPTSRVSAFVRVGRFREERDNAKKVTGVNAPEDPEANDTTWKSVSGGVRLILPDSSSLQARLFGDSATFHSNFLAVPNLITRAIGRKTLDQEVPTNGFGGMVQWSRSFGARNSFTAGSDWRWVDGDSEENAMDAVTGTTVVTRRISGGTQRSLGFFMQDVLTPTDRLSLTLSARVDKWQNYDAHNLETTVATGLPVPAVTLPSGVVTGNRPNLPDKEDAVLSPRAAALYRLTDRVSAWGSISAGFRAPTLNELYRQFRVGALLVLANDQLDPERLVGGEAGLNISATDDVTIRTTWYDNRIENPVSQVTIGANLQQRRNLGKTRVRGFQSDVEYRYGSTWRFSGAYLFNDAKVTENASTPELVGKYLPQVPKHRGSLQVAYTDPRIVNVALGVQRVGRQFDDDLNARGVPSEGCAVQSQSCASPGLPGFTVVELTASRRIGRSLEAFFGVQNLFDEEFYVQTNPTTIGVPRLFHGGVRLRFAGR